MAVAGACGETPCWSRSALTFTQANTGRNYTFTPAWPGNVQWDFGDGTPKVTSRGPAAHTYAGAGAVNVLATPVASACLKAGAATPITVT